VAILSTVEVDMRRVLCVLALMIAFVAPGANADDIWESSSICSPDDFAASCNQLLHGAIQTHDLQGTSAAPDQDWMVVETKIRHSYEARAFNTAIPFKGAGCSNCADFDRVNGTGTVLTGPFGPDGGGPWLGFIPSYVVVRWIGAANQRDWIRVIGPTTGATLTASDKYDIQLRDTTYFISRWNQSGSQVTVFLIQNNSQATVTGSIYFYDAAGALLSTQALSVPVSGLQILSTAGIPALSGLSGSAAIAHLGPYGALTGKVVALEPGTGFTFDTLISPLPY
jgi:hypothetical protein